jgi:hypothetical protein
LDILRLMTRGLERSRRSGRRLRQFTVANSNHRNHTVQTRALHGYLRWRNKNARHREVIVL